MTKNKINQLVNTIIKIRTLATDEQAVEIQALYPEWKSNIQYKTGERVLYNDILYKVLTDHTSQSDWTPNNAVSLFAKMLIPNSDIIPEWVQPESTNPYMVGDKVIYNELTWISNIDNNVWEPGVFGWEVYN